MQTSSITCRAITAITASANNRTVAHGLGMSQALIDPVIGSLLIRRIWADPVQLEPFSLLAAETHDAVFGFRWVEDISGFGMGRGASAAATAIVTAMVGRQATEGTGSIPGRLVLRRMGRVVRWAAWVMATWV